MQLKVLNGIVDENPHRSFHSHQFADGTFDTDVGFVMMGGSSLGFSRADELKGPHRPHQWHWSDTAHDGWSQVWAADQRANDYFGKSGQFAGDEDAEEVVVLWDSEPYPHDAETSRHSSMFVGGDRFGPLSYIGMAYNALAPMALAEIGRFVVQAASERYPGKKIRFALVNLLRQPAYAATGPKTASDNAKKVVDLLRPSGFALDLKLRFTRTDRPRDIDDAVRWSMAALSARSQFGHPYTFAESWWEDTGDPTPQLPQTYQLAGAMAACALEGIPIAITGGAKEIDEAGLLDRFEQNVRNAREIALAWIEAQDFPDRDDIEAKHAHVDPRTMQIVAVRSQLANARGGVDKPLEDLAEEIQARRP